MIRSRRIKRTISNYKTISGAFYPPSNKLGFTFRKRIKDLNPHLTKGLLSDLSKTLIEEWKNEYLNDAERISWKILQQLRNDDTHRAPVNSNYELKEHELITKSGQIITTIDGNIIVFASENITVLFEGKEFDILGLTLNGISAIRKLINYMPLIKEKSDAYIV